MNFIRVVSVFRFYSSQHRRRHKNLWFWGHERRTSNEILLFLCSFDAFYSHDTDRFSGLSRRSLGLVQINSPVHYTSKRPPWNSADHEQCLENDSFWIYRSVLISRVCPFFASRSRERELKNFGPVQVSIGVLYRVGIC